MVSIGILVTLLGFAIGFLGLGLTQSVSVRLAMVLAGLAVSFTGIFGLINRAYLKNAIWRR